MLINKTLILTICFLTSGISWSKELFFAKEYNSPYMRYTLDEKIAEFPEWIYYVLLFCVALIALSRLLSDQFFPRLFKAVSSDKARHQMSKEGLTPFHASGWLLWLNYILLASLGVYIFTVKADLSPILSLIPLLYFIAILFFYLFTSSLIGKKKYFLALIENFFYLHQICGLILFPIILIWVLNLKSLGHFQFLFLGLIFAIQVYRWIQGIGAKLQLKTPWYYIILYLCTLEIAPFVALGLYLR